MLTGYCLKPVSVFNCFKSSKRFALLQDVLSAVIVYVIVITWTARPSLTDDNDTPTGSDSNLTYGWEMSYSRPTTSTSRHLLSQPLARASCFSSKNDPVSYHYQSDSVSVEVFLLYTCNHSIRQR